MTHRALRQLTAIVAMILVGRSVFAVPAKADGGEYGELVPNEFIVTLKPDGTIGRAVSGLPLSRPPEQLVPGSRVWKVTFPSSNYLAAVDRLKNADGVEIAQPNPVTDLPEYSGAFILFWADWSAQPIPAPSSAYRLTQPALNGVTFGPTLAGNSGRGITVAVLDTGIDATHPAFAGRYAGGFDVIDGDAFPGESKDGLDNNGNGLRDEAFGHGTHVAGLVALAAPKASILAIRALDSDGGSNAWKVLQALERASLGNADVINMSFGGGWLGPAVDDRIKTLSESGVVVVAAAGNEATSTTQYPAGSDHVLSVNAINSMTGQPADFSNRGSWVDVAAPGVALVSAFPGGTYAAWGGTSSSAPLVSALAARLRQLHPSIDSSALADKITASADATTLPNFSAYGLVKPSGALLR